MTRFARLWILGRKAGLYDSAVLSWSAIWARDVKPGPSAGHAALCEALGWAEQHGYAVLGSACRLSDRTPLLLVA